MKNKIIALIFWIIATICYVIIGIVCDLNDTWVDQLCNCIILFCQGGIICNYIVDIISRKE